ncbi:MAG TPA: hypothetical protein VK442_07770 [Xanthobacteraceae bacterium]|nr:hypothetical protein [Xanthobacteraceae bacterium]
MRPSAPRAFVQSDLVGDFHNHATYALDKACGSHAAADMNVGGGYPAAGDAIGFLKVADMSVRATATYGGTLAVAMANPATRRLPNARFRSLPHHQISAPAARRTGRKSYLSQKVQFPSAAQSMLTRPSTWASTKALHVLQTGHCHIQPTSGRFRKCILRSLPNGVSYSRGTHISLAGHRSGSHEVSARNTAIPNFGN